MKGKLIVIDGLDGSGKQTQTEFLFERLKGENLKVCRTSFPNYASKTGEIVKMYLNGELGGVNDVNAYQGSISYALDRYVSFLNDDWGRKYRDGYLVICDRYTTSNMIHQGTKIRDNELLEYIKWLEDLEYYKLQIPKPDSVLFLDVPITVSKKILEKRVNKFDNKAKLDIHERDIVYLEKCYYVSQELCKLKDWIKINCTENEEFLKVEEINDKIYNKVISRL